MTTLPEGLDDETHKKALVFGKLAAKTYDYDDNQVAKAGLSFFSGIDDVKQQDFITPDYRKVGTGGGFVDFLVDSGLDYTVFEERKEGNIVLAFRGTEPLSIQDWFVDIKQALSLVTGTGEQYKVAIELAMKMSETLRNKGKQLSFTGESYDLCNRDFFMD